MNKTRKLTMCAMFVTFGLILSYIEALFPLNFSVPGIKLGLANLLTILVLYYFDWKSAILVNILRIVISSLLFSSLSMMIYSISGAILSFIALLIARKLSFSTVSMSIVAALFHNIGQIICAMIVVENFKLIVYLPVLMVSAVICGGIVGVISDMIIKKVPLKMIQK